jgi:acetolactate decarboxylase
VTVRWVGAQRDVLGGDVSGKIDLRAVATAPHLYALGPRAGVTGEITVFDGRPSIARVVDGRVQVEASLDHGACFLVFDHVAAWHDAVQRRGIDDEAALTSAVLQAAGAAGLDADAEPLIFLLRAPAATVTYHVLDKRDERPHTPARHEEAKVRFTVEREAVDVLGFYSPRHRGIFTPRDSDLHMHLRTADGRASGHVEQIAVEAGAVIAVPRKETR